MSIAVNLRSKAVIKSFLGRFKDTLRNQFRYWEHEDLKAIIEYAIHYFNYECPDSKLKEKPPALFRKGLVA